MSGQGHGSAADVTDSGLDEELLEAARRVRERAHAPYSDYRVGAALRTASGAVHAGCNVENASYPEGWCAETSAIAAMIASAGDVAGRSITAICVVAAPIDGRLVTPCGGCRQRLAEFGRSDTVVHVAGPDGAGHSYRLAELLPAAFALETKS
jgi:cytidine deaminase